MNSYICDYCGKRFEAHRRQYQKVYCSLQCSKKAIADKHRKTKITVCLGCGVTFMPKAAERNKYCSRECAYKNRYIRKPKPEPKPIRQCFICGKDTVWKYCSEDCRKEGARLDEHARTITPRACTWCGVEFVPERHSKCWSQCCVEHKRLEKRRRSKKSPSQRLHKGGVSIAKRERIWKRDGYKCQLCGKPLAMGKRSTTWNGNPHPHAPVVDHIVPMSVALEMGWTKAQANQESNLQAAHWRCNTEKGNGVAYDQLRIC